MKITQRKRPRLLSLTHQRRQRGQMAIFVVLVFQVLFVFFAMTLNVALVVHDKINLQNSVDLAALYGAQKQAEVLNVIAHINFQMRQNFKLLTWRYRILSSITYLHGPSFAGGEYWCPYVNNSELSGGRSSGSKPYCSRPWNNKPQCVQRIYHEYCDANYFVCISAAIWARGEDLDSGTNHCKHLETELQAVVPFPIEPNNPLMGLVTSLLDQNLALGRELAKKCEKEGFYNWLITQMFLGHFRLDQKDRKIMIREIYQRTLQLGLDLDGNSIRKGMLETFQKNLTYTNRTNFQNNTEALEEFHSPQGKEFSSFFTPLNVFPVLEYLDFPGATGSDDSNCGNSERTPHYQLPKLGVTPSNPAIQQFVNQWRWLFDLSTDPRTRGSITSPPPSALPPSPPNIFFTEDALLAPLTLGYERTEEIFYYGVSVTVNYDSAFPLFFPGLSGDGDLQLKASALAKPFGGRIGPKKTDLDPLIKKPILIDSGNTHLASGNPFLLKPNYSRYPGDRWGLIHKEAHQQYYLKKPSGPGFGMPSPPPFDIMHFSHLYGGDPLAYNRSVPRFLFVRMMELMAVAPDLYDMTYYSPLNHYMTAYFPRICHLFTGSDCPEGNRAISIGNVTGGGVTVQAFLRGDFGFPYTQKYSNLNKDKFGVLSPLSSFYFNLGTTNFEIAHLPQYPRYINQNVAPWLVKDPAHFLTAWVPTTTKERYENYVFPEEIFGKCRAVAKKDEPLPSGCVTGGRAGYSVKLISCEMASEFQPSHTLPPYACP
ncbi:MAG: pilus assembly protein TadG-related protein [Bdellovibrionales bacterium]|nr:pilus assembly protein TadG-related protein [Bdellovibrionales bacterium]